jgi:hypothetical protein
MSPTSPRSQHDKTIAYVPSANLEQLVIYLKYGAIYKNP